MRQKTKSRPRRKGNNRRDSWEDRESRDMKRDDSSKSTKSSNDPKWYATDASLLRDSASIPFSWPVGQAWKTDYPTFPTGAEIHDTEFNSETIPGLCVLYLVPTFGANLQSDALNVAASSMYTYVRHTNAGHANYDPNDLMLYVMAMTQVYSYVNYLERLYAIATLYDQKNRYLPDALFKAQSVDPDSIKNNLADFRYGINVLINKVSSIAVPATMSIFLRHAMLYSYVYSEGSTIKDQLYMYAPLGFYKFSLDDDMAGQLTFVSHMNGSNTTWDHLINFGNELFSAIWDQEDFGIMSGDILKSYGSNILSLSSLNEVVPFGPVYDPMVLHQMKNATSFNYYTRSMATVKQNAAKNRLIADVGMNNLIAPALNAQWANTQGNRVLTLDSENPTPEMVIEATRLMNTIDSASFDTATSTWIVHYAAGSEMVGDTVYYYYEDSNYDNLKSVFSSSLAYVDVAASGASTMHSPLKVLHDSAIVKAFKYSPRLVSVWTNTAGDTLGGITRLQEVDNYAVLSPNDIEKQHTAAVLNLLNVPSVAKSSSRI